jgi:hypothetical protein
MLASVAQSVEHLHGKEGVTGSNPVGGFLSCVGEGGGCNNYIFVAFVT